MSPGIGAGPICTSVLTLPDSGPSDARAEISSGEVLSAFAGALEPVVFVAAAYLDEVGRRMFLRVESGRRVRPVDSLRLEATRLLAGVTSELGDREDLFVVADHRDFEDVHEVALAAAGSGEKVRAVLSVARASDVEGELVLTVCEGALTQSGTRS